MKPREAGDYLRTLAKHVSLGTEVPEYIRTWFCPAVSTYLAGSEKHLDQLLYLRSRNGGRHTLHCQIPARDEALCCLAESLGLPTAKARAKEIENLNKQGKLKDIEKLGRIPGHVRIEQILSK